MESLHIHVPKEILPSELGGTQGKFDNSNCAKAVYNNQLHFTRVQQFVQANTLWCVKKSLWTYQNVIVSEKFFTNKQPGGPSSRPTQHGKKFFFLHKNSCEFSKKLCEFFKQKLSQIFFKNHMNPSPNSLPCDFCRKSVIIFFLKNHMIFFLKIFKAKAGQQLSADILYKTI